MKLKKPKVEIADDVQIAGFEVFGPVGGCTRYAYSANIGIDDGADFDVFESGRALVNEPYDRALAEFRAASQSTDNGDKVSTQEIAEWKSKLKTAQEAAAAFSEFDLMLRQKADMYVNLPGGGVTKNAKATLVGAPPAVEKPAEKPAERPSVMPSRREQPTVAPPTDKVI